MDLNVILTIHLDSFRLSSTGAVTIRDVDGECHAIETFTLLEDSTLSAAAKQLAEYAHYMLADVSDQLRLFS